jgi:hypothetical protein
MSTTASTTAGTTTGPTTTTAPPARDDVRPAGTVVPTAREARKQRRAEVHAARASALPAVPTRTVRRAGLGVALGSLVWATTFFTVGPTPEDSLAITIGDLGGVLFQAGLFGLLTVQLRTRATGLGRGAVALLRVEYVLLALAMLWSLVHGLVPAARDDMWLAVLDLFWPLSMLGMAVIGVKIALAGRWRGVLRGWPLVAESWAPVTVPVFVITAGDPAFGWVGGAHLLVGYVLLGVLMVLRPHLTGARDA